MMLIIFRASRIWPWPGPAQVRLHERAAAATRKHFGNKVFVRAVVEVSNYCRENCAYCGMRRDNATLPRFRAQPEQLAEFLIHHRPASVTDINIQAGEDPVAVREVVLPLIRTLRRETPLGHQCLSGHLDAGLYRELQEAGASIYIMKFEVGGCRAISGIFRTRHVWTNDCSTSGCSRRPAGMSARVSLPVCRARPWPTCGAILRWPGRCRCMVAVSARLFRARKPRWRRRLPPNADWTLNCIAALRLMRPDWVIPAVSALNLMEPDGYRHGLRAGANLVTMNLTPGMCGADYVIYKRDRFIMTEERVLSALAAEGLEPSKTGLADFYRRRYAKSPAVNPVRPPRTRPDFTCCFHRQLNPDPSSASW